MPNLALRELATSKREVRLVYLSFSLATAVSTLDPQDAGFVSSVTNNGTGLYDIVFKHHYQKLLACDFTIVKATAADSKWQVMGELGTTTLSGETVSTMTVGNIDLETPALSAPADSTIKLCVSLQGRITTP